MIVHFAADEQRTHTSSDNAAVWRGGSHRYHYRLLPFWVRNRSKTNSGERSPWPTAARILLDLMNFAPSSVVGLLLAANRDLLHHAIRPAGLR